MTYPMRHVAVEIAHADRQAALSRLERAKERRDTQAIRRAQIALERATEAALAAEIAAGLA